MASFDLEGESQKEVSAGPGPFDGTRVVVDPVKGRCLETTTARRMGEILYVEGALIYSSYMDDIEPDNAELLQQVYGAKVCGYMNKVYDMLATLPKIECLDTARNLVQMVAVVYLKDQSGSATMHGYGGPDLAGKINLLEKLQSGTTESVNACIEDIKKFKKIFPNVFPKKGGMTTEKVGALLAMLNNNQVELEDFGGSGLFVGTAIIEHSCNFNCSYTTKGSKLFMTATRDIPQNSRLSIDYGNLFYSPTEERQKYLLDSYGFHCDCEMCCGPDRKKAYSCPSCSLKGDSGVVCLLPNTDSNGSGNAYLTSPCLVCDQVAQAEHIVKCLEREKALLEAPPETFEEVLSVGNEGLLHESHHLLFSIVDILARDHADEAQRKALFIESGGINDVKIDEVFGPAVTAMRHCCRLMDMVLPLVSLEKVIYYDRLGQLSVCAGHIDVAKQAFGSAYQMSCFASGQESPLSRKLLALAEHTPTTKAELREHFEGDSISMDI